MPVAELESFERKIENTPQLAGWAAAKLTTASECQFVENSGSWLIGEAFAAA